MAESLGNGEHSDLQVEKHRARAADGGLPEVPENLQPRGASAVVRAGSRGGGGSTGTAVPSKSGRGCLLFLLLLFLSSHSPSSSQDHPLSPPQLASPWGGTQHQASWTLLRSFLLSPPLFSPAWGGGFPSSSFYTSSLCLTALGSLTIYPQFSPILLRELCDGFCPRATTPPGSLLPSKLCKHGHTWDCPPHTHTHICAYCIWWCTQQDKAFLLLFSRPISLLLTGECFCTELNNIMST